MRRPALCLLLAALPVLTAACTDWDAKGGATGPRLQQQGPSGVVGSSDGGASDGGLAYLETWQPPQPDATADTAMDAAADATVLADVAADVPRVDDGALAVDVTAVADGTGVDDGTVDDAADAAAAADVPPYSLDGKADFGGWPALPDAVSATSDAVAADGGDTDGAGGAVTADGGAAVDGAGPADAGISVDGGVADGGVADGGVADGGAAVDSAGATDGGGGTSADAAPAPTLPDGAALPDWQGYGELPFGDDADIYGGPINSCLGLYLYQLEGCGDSAPSAACIDTVAKDGSLYAQFLFEPLRQCEQAACVGLCQGATGKTCWDQCIAKYCAAQFFACTANAQQGSQTCAETWACANAYPDKLLTVSSKCYAAASPLAQQQFSAVLSCVSQPQQASCVPQIATCYGAGPDSPGTCSAMLQCFASCGSDEACGAACLGKASPQAVQLLDAAVSCQVQQCKPKCGGDKACEDACSATTCKGLFDACAAN